MISRKDIEYTANLARLGVKEKHIDELTDDMQKIIGFVEQINRIDTENVTPLLNVNDLSNVNREDEIQESLSNEIIEKNAPEFEDGHIVIPKVIE